MLTLFRSIVNTIATASLRAAGVVLNVSGKFLSLYRFVVGTVIVYLFASVIGIVMGFENVVFVSSMLLSITLIVAFDVTRIGLNILNTILKPFSISLYQLKKIILPIRTISLTVSFIAVVVAVRGLADFGWGSLMVIMSVGTFFIILNKYWPERRMIYECILTCSLILIVLVNYVFPVQLKAVIFWSERSTIETSQNIDGTISEGDLILLTKETVLYNENRQPIKTIQNDLKAKITKTVTLGKSKENYYEVFLPNDKGDYTDDESYYFPVRRSGLQILKKETEKKEKIINVSDNLNNTKFANTTNIGYSHGNSTLYFYADRPFNIIYSLNNGSAGYSTVTKPAGYSSQVFDNKGDIVVDELNRTDIKIIDEKFKRK